MSAPHSSSTILAAGVSGGRIAALGVTITVARARRSVRATGASARRAAPVEPRLRRPRVVDHRRVDLQHRPLAERGAGQDAFAAEVVVALDDRVGFEPRASRVTARVRAQRSSLRPNGGAIASSGPDRRGTAPAPGTTRTWTSCPSARQPLGHRGRRAPSRRRCRARLIDRAVEDAQAQIASTPIPAPRPAAALVPSSPSRAGRKTGLT